MLPVLWDLCPDPCGVWGEGVEEDAGGIGPVGLALFGWFYKSGTVGVIFPLAQEGRGP